MTDVSTAGPAASSDSSAFPGFRAPRVLLPRPGVDLTRWAVIACDQYTAEPEYWQRVAEQVGDAPSTLQLIFPEVFLGQPGASERVARIQQHMGEYTARGLLREHEGLVLVERTLPAAAHGGGAGHAGGAAATRTRRGLMLELDLEHYDFSAGSQSLIRPTEGTIVARLAPRIEVRRGAPLELPHVLVLIDDPACTVIEPLVEDAAARAELTPLYDTDLMLGAGHLRGHAIAPARAARALQALAALAAPQAFCARYGVPPGTPPMLFPVGDGNHSLATAKSLWEELKREGGADVLSHPARWALVEVVNIHDPALVFEPIHRLLFGVTGDLKAALGQALGERVTFMRCDSGEALRAQLAARATRGAEVQAAGLIAPEGRFELVEVRDPPAPLAVGTLQPILDAFVAAGSASEIDYVHGDDVLERLAQRPGHLGLHIPTVGKSELLERVVKSGPLPRKTFSMGEADEKRFYFEARRIR